MARRLAKREKALILIAVAILLLIVILPQARGFARRYSESQSELEQARQFLELAQLNRQSILDDRAANSAFREIRQKQGGLRDLFAFVNQCVIESDLQNRAEIVDASHSSQPKVVIVRVTLTQINLEELVDVLHRIYSRNRLVTLNRLTHLRASRTGNGLECQLELKTPRS